MHAIECSSCGTGTGSNKLHTVGPPRLTICATCLHTVVQFLCAHKLQRRQPFLNRFQSMLEENSRGTAWMLHMNRSDVKAQGLTPTSAGIYMRIETPKALGEDCA